MALGKIAVIVPVFNTREYLSACLDSLKNQTYEDLEIILINDGSTDGSASICDEAAAADARIRVLHQKNRGLSAARNMGIETSKSEYITFVDSDDWLHPKFMTALCQLMEDESVDVTICRLMRTDAGTAVIGDEWSRAFGMTEGLQFMDRHLPGLITVSCGKLYRRGLFEGIRFPEGRFHEDEFTTYKLLFRANRIGITNRFMYFHRIRPDSITQAKRTHKRAIDALDAFMERGCFFKSEGLKDLAVSAFRHAFYLYRQYSQELFTVFSLEEKAEWLRYGNEIFRVLKTLKVPLRSRLFYEAYFRLPPSMRCKLI